MHIVHHVVSLLLMVVVELRVGALPLFLISYKDSPVEHDNSRSYTHRAELVNPIPATPRRVGVSPKANPDC